MFLKSAAFYDRIYQAKDYAAESQRLVELIRRQFEVSGGKLLDVACGTGRHIEYLKGHFEVQGVDLSEELLETARQRNPGIRFRAADMLDFDLQEQFEVVVCLFSAIGYVKTLDNLHNAVGCMARHLRPGGGLIIEPWFTPETWQPGSVHAAFIDEPELKIVRMNTSQVDGKISFFDFHYLVGTPAGVEYFSELHELGLFTRSEMEEAFEQPGLEVFFDDQGLTGRGLYLGKKPI
jgi:SAM-dependent methyltransferase